MTKQKQPATGPRPAGYQALIARFGLAAISNWHRSAVARTGPHRIATVEGVVEETYPAKYWPGDSLGDHLEFALKYDGVNLAILASVFQVAPQKEVVAYVRSKPRGQYARRVWYLYEFLTDSTLPLDDLSTGGYIDLLDTRTYVTNNQPHSSRRQKIRDNLLGDRNFCPTIRCTDTLRILQAKNLVERCRKIVSKYPPELLKRALAYLYTKETKSSFEIEHVLPNSARTERFIALLQLAEKEDFCDKPHLLDLQNRVVDPRFNDTDYRKIQNYVGESVSPRREKVHYACPKPEDLPTLMSGLIAAHRQMEAGDVSPVVHAAAIAYGFVFLHPFEDGNGRIHRFLIHNILARRGFTPEGLMFPISAAMLKHPAEYDASLEAFSRPLLSVVDYDLDENGRMTVTNDTARWYAYIDMTAQTEALYQFIEQTIETELPEELSFLARYDQTKAAIQEVVDMPDRQIDLFIRFCLQNKGKLSARKRASEFETLTDDEVARMEAAVQTAYSAQTSAS